MSRPRPRALGSLFALCFCACTDAGLGVLDTGTPLPAGGLPPGQTLEGGAQVRLSPAGLAKIKDVAVAALHEGIEGPMCVGQMSVLAADVCYTNQGACTPGCSLDVGVAAPIAIAVTDANTLNVKVTASAAASIRIAPPLFSACTLSLGIDRLYLDADIGFSIDPVTGAFSAALDTINETDLSQVNYSGCAVIANLGSIIPDVLDSILGTWIVDSVVPTLNAVVADRLDSRGELAGLVDLPAFALTGLAASNGSLVEVRSTPGGYVQLSGGGMSLGVITGFNSDSDPQTRSALLASEPATCVPDLVAPDLAAPPASLATTSRGTFSLPPAGAFAGMPDAADDLVVGISRSALDLAGHHLIASGGLCLDVDDARVAFLRRDALDDLLGVPLSVSDTPLRLVVRPHRALRFDIGTGTTESPHLRASLDEVQIDVEPTAAPGSPLLRITTDVGLGMLLHTRHEPGVPVRLETTRSELDVANSVVTAIDARYASVDAAALTALASTAADVVFSTLGADAGTFPVAGIAGMDAENVRVERITTANGVFLAVAASLGEIPPSPGAPAPTPQPASVTLVLPTPAALRTALLAGDTAGLPTVHVALPTADGARPLEHAWRTAGGAWRPYEATGDLVIRDRSFAWQGERTIELRSRVVGDDGTTSAIGSTPVTIDYAPPTIFPDPVIVASHLVVPARDALSEALEWAMGRVGEDVPATGWTSDSNLDLATARALGEEIVVYVRDGNGNLAHATVTVPEPNAAAAVFACVTLAWRSRRRARRG